MDIKNHIHSLKFPFFNIISSVEQRVPLQANFFWIASQIPALKVDNTYNYSSAAKDGLCVHSCILAYSVADPWHFCVDPDLRIHASD